MSDIKDDVIDIDLSATRKKRFRIDGDNTRVLELNVSDMNIVSRVDTAYQKLQSLAVKASEKLGSLSKDSDDVSTEVAETVDEIDAEMRGIIDELFDANVSEVCAPSGTMYDLFNGQFRYEHIIETLSTLYENNFNAEFKAMKNRIANKTAKYTNKKKKS